MAVSLICPNCDKTLRLKSDPAGKKVRCPSCGEAFAADQGQSTAVTERKAKKPAAVEEEPEDREEDIEEEERPRKKKKKKKKQKTNTKLWLAVGGGAAGIIVLALVLILFVFPGGDSKGGIAKGPPVPPPGPGLPPGPGPAPIVPGGKTPIGGIPRRMEITEVLNLMKQLGIAYHNYYDVNRRGPKNAKELAPFLERNSKILQGLNEKWITFQWGANLLAMREGTSRTIIAYETQADRNGRRAVLFGDASVAELDEADFAKAPRAE